jgi:hypothetical protein
VSNDFISEMLRSDQGYIGDPPSDTRSSQVNQRSSVEKSSLWATVVCKDGHTLPCRPALSASIRFRKRASRW